MVVINSGIHFASLLNSDAVTSQLTLKGTQSSMVDDLAGVLWDFHEGTTNLNKPLFTLNETDLDQPTHVIFEKGFSISENLKEQNISAIFWDLPKLCENRRERNINILMCIAFGVIFLGSLALYLKGLEVGDKDMTDIGLSFTVSFGGGTVAGVIMARSMNNSYNDKLKEIMTKYQNSFPPSNEVISTGNIQEGQSGATN